MEEGIINILANVKLFKDFTMDELSTMAVQMKTRVAPVDSMICTEGEMGQDFFIIITGKVQILKKDHQNKEHELSNLQPGDCFGEMSLIDLQPRSASVKAVEETKVASLSHEAFYKMQDEMLPVYSHILLNIAKEFSLRLRNMDSKYIKLLGFFF